MDFYNYGKDMITNATTGLMALRDLATIYKIPINIQLDDHYITVIVNYGKCDSQMQQFYLQDMYRYEQDIDHVYKWVTDTIQEIVDARDEIRSKED